MNFRICWPLSFAIISMNAVCQTPVKHLEKLAAQKQQEYQLQKEKVLQFAADHNMPISFTDGNGNEILMTGINENGIPVYRTTFNAGAASTTGADRLYSGGDLGLDLSGDGITVGIWDGGRVKQSHVEFGNRIVSVQGNALSSHAIHVTGTILASGVVPSARGMAPGAKATTWDYDNDEAEIAALAESLLFSNHSYGTLCGWYHDGSWRWAGDPSISSSEDYKFGFYSDRSQLIDDIACNAPYYTIVWAAGNDRNTVGNGVDYPADGNGGSGYDCLHPDAVAKNIITVGAISKIGTYTGPGSVDITSFSSWGPTDDGRIKPDLVGVGQAVYSTNIGSGGSDSYSYESGTSMAAPNVTGSLVLLQELYSDLHAGNYMKAATLKALAIHTAKEAGNFPGPDYSYGWGVLDVDSAAKVLLAEDQHGVMVSESTLLQGDVIEFEITPRENSPVTATIVWTDPAGTPVAASLDPTNRMLVNDLDLRIVDMGGNVNYPWIVNPASPSSAASRGDNFRDNVEKIQFTATEGQTYTVQISHKGTLANGAQDFSLILSYAPISDTRTVYYWIGGSGDWDDPAHWSSSSGGTSAGTVPDENSRVFFDSNSFSGVETVSLQGDASCGSFTWLAKNGSGLSLNGFTLFVHGSMGVTSKNFNLQAGGTIQFSDGLFQQATMNIDGVDLSSADIVIDAPQSTFTVNGGVQASSINLAGGNLIAANTALEVNALVSNSASNRTLDLSGAAITDVTQLSLSGANLNLLSENATIEMKSSASTSADLNGIVFDGTLAMQGGTLNLTGEATLHKLMADGDVLLNGNNIIRQLEVAAGSHVQFQSGSQQAFTEVVTLHSNATDRISLSTLGAGTSEVHFAGHYKSCFDYVDVSDVHVATASSATISAGVNSTFVNALNWPAIVCDEALFPNFAVRFNCAGARMEFINTSDGNIVSYAWNFGDPSSLQNTTDAENPVHTYTAAGVYTVELTVSDGLTSKTYSRPTEVIVNDLSVNSVVISNDKLFSAQLANEYQWYRNDSPIPGATSRSYDYGGDAGTYFVLIRSEACNIQSNVFVVNAAEPERRSGEIMVFPNPADDEVTVSISPEFLPARLHVVNLLGQTVYADDVSSDTPRISLSDWRDGVYILYVIPDTSFGKMPVKTKLMIRHK